jgi:hypothetical protein
MSLSLIVPVNSALAYGDELLVALSTSKGNIRSGNLRLHLGLEARETYDDNIFNTAVNEKEDFITTITPGALVSLGDRNKIELGYAFGVHRYNDYSDEDFVSQHGRAMVDMNFPSGVRIDFVDTYLATEDPRPEELQLRASHKSNDIDASVGYEFPAQKLTIEAFYSMRYLKFDQVANRALNKIKNIFGAAIYYKFLPKTSAFMEYRYGLTDFFDSPNGSTDKDARTYAVMAGIKLDPTAKLSGTIKTGWKSKEYENVTDDNGNLYSDKNLWSAEGLITYKATERTKFDIALNRSLEDTEYGGNFTYSRATNYLNTGGMIGVEHKLTPKLTLIGGMIGVEHKLTPKLTLIFNAGFQSHEYNRIQPTQLEREDEVVDMGVGLVHKMRDWLTAGIKYTYYENDSNDPSRDERHNKVVVSIAGAI